MMCPVCGEKTGFKIINFNPIYSTIVVPSKDNKCLFMGETEKYEETEMGAICQCVSCKYSEVTSAEVAMPPSFFEDECA